MASKNHTPKRLYRSTSNSVIAGVAGGLGEFFAIDPIILRLLFVVTLFFGGAGLVVYILMWLIVPADTKVVKGDNQLTSSQVEKSEAKPETVDDSDDVSQSKRTLGILLVVVGSVFLLNNLGLVRMFDVFRFWPIAIVLLGIVLITKRD